MECGRDGWSMISYTSGAQDKSIINRIMLRFRPIAPKPATGAEAPGGSLVDGKKTYLPKGRTKRKYVRVRRNNSGYQRKKTTGRSKDVGDNRVATLQLLPEKSDLEFSKNIRSWGCDEKELDRTAAKNNHHPPEGNLGPPLDMDDNKGARNDKMWDQRVVETWVTVEYVTGKCMDGMMGFGGTDVERISNLEGDTCPGLVSDGMNRVEWVNGAFKRMVKVKVMRGGEEEEGQSWEIRVRLVVKEKLPYSCYSSFSCHVKVEYWLGKDKYTQMMPCDVCKMDGGGFAWRLDVEAALTLGR